MSKVPHLEESAQKDTLKQAISTSDEQQVAEIVESNTSQEVLRQASQMKADDRDQLISILPPDAAAELIEEAPAKLAAPSMVQLGYVSNVTRLLK